MLTRKNDAWLSPTARRLLGRNGWKISAGLLAAPLLSLAMGAAALADDGSAGVVRVSDHPIVPASNVVSDPVTPGPKAMPAAAPQPAANAPNASNCPGPNACTCDDCRRDRGCRDNGDCRRGLLGRSCCCLFRDGCGWRFLDAHCYCMTYAFNPWYCDHRDGAVYAAYGYGAPMTVPLAPNVTNQYNYGWGIPSGRLTPISRVAYRPGALTTAVAPY